MKKLLYTSVIVILTVLVFASCKDDVPSGMNEIKLYFSNAEKNGLAFETDYIKSDLMSDKKELVSTVMNRLFKGPSSSSEKPIIPLGVSLRGVSVNSDDKTEINIDLAGDYYRDPSQDGALALELLSRYSIIYTLCQFDGIDKVQIYVNGKQLRSDNGTGEFVEAIGSENIMTSAPSDGDSSSSKLVTLYFADSDGKLLEAESRRVKNKFGSYEKTLINELIAGPRYETHKAVIPSGTRLISIEQTEGVCFVNLSGEFASGLKPGSQEEKIAVYSIVNTLTRLSEIEKVQILTDGKKRENDPSSLYSSPLERDPSYIKEAVK